MSQAVKCYAVTDQLAADIMPESPFTRNVRRVIRSIPAGRVASYAQVAALAGNHRAVRGVVWILHASSEASGLPWHRVINSRGAISLPRGRGFEEQRQRLIAEGVAVSRTGKVTWRASSGSREKREAPPSPGPPLSSSKSLDKPLPPDFLPKGFVVDELKLEGGGRPFVHWDRPRSGDRPQDSQRPRG